MLEHGVLAVNGYVDVFRKMFDLKNWIECYESIQAAYHIACMMGTNTDAFKQIRSIILQTLMEIESFDILKSYYKKMKLNEAIKEVTTQYASYYEFQARKSANKNDFNIRF